VGAGADLQHQLHVEKSLLATSFFCIFVHIYLAFDKSYSAVYRI